MNHDHQQHESTTAAHTGRSGHAGQPAHEGHAHDKHAGHSVAMFRQKFEVSLLLTIPALVWGEMLPHALGFTPFARPGAAAPADGVVREGRSSVNESMITGESRPVPKDVGEQIIAGTVNGEGSLRVEITRTGDRTTLAGIMI